MSAKGSGDFSRLPSAWAHFLPNGYGDLPNLDTIYAAPGHALPTRAHLFRAFHATPPDLVRVVLLGQDPYPAAGMADGLAFSQPGEVRSRSALNRLFLNLERDPNVPFARPKTGDLSAWAARGVLLMNTALTVDEGVPKSHLARWAKFSSAVLQSLNDPRRRIAFILLGEDAIDLAVPQLTKVPAESIVRAAHPMAGNPGQERPFHTSHVFSEANAFLSEPAVQWSLT